MIVMPLHNSLGNPTETFRILTLLCHSQMVEMGVIALLIELPEWQGYYDLVSDSLFLSMMSRVCFVQISSACFQCFCLKSTFDLQAPSDGTPLYETLPLTVSPQSSPPVSQSLMPQRWTLQPPSFSMLLEAVMVHMVVPGLQILWRVGFFLRCLFRGG